MHEILLPNGVAVPCLGQGTWRMAERRDQRADETAALHTGIDCGMVLLDTAEMYADGAAETLVGEVVSGIRDRVFIVSKAYPQNASRTRLPKACEASLRRLGTDRIDLYLLHWRGTVKLQETVEAMEALVAAGKIRAWGVSNLDTADMKELIAAGGTACATDQILYNLMRRGPERELMPWLQSRNIPVMAYSPVEQGKLLKQQTLVEIAGRRNAPPAQIALAWVLRQKNVIAIPKSGSVAHVQENFEATKLSLSESEIGALDAAFPVRGAALEML